MMKRSFDKENRWFRGGAIVESVIPLFGEIVSFLNDGTPVPKTAGISFMSFLLINIFRFIPTVVGHGRIVHRRALFFPPPPEFFGGERW